MYAGASAVLWLMISMFGTIAVLATGMPDGADILQSFIGWLASQQNGVADAASGLLFVSLIAMALVTMSAMFSATLATIRYDLIPALSPGPAQPDQALARRRAVTAGGGVCVAMLIILSLLNDYLDPSFAGARFANLQLACFCAQLAFAPLVVGPMVFGNAGIMARLGQSRYSEPALPRGKASLLSVFNPNTERGCGPQFRRVSQLAGRFMRLRCCGPTECRRPRSGNRVVLNIFFITQPGQKSSEHRTMTWPSSLLTNCYAY